MSTLKGILISLLAGVFLFASLGFTLVSHRCNDRLVKSKIVVFNPKLSCGFELLNECDEGPVKENSLRRNCCSNESYELKLDDYQVDYSVEIDFQSADASKSHTPFVFQKLSQKIDLAWVVRPPPQPLHLINCVFLI